MNKRYYSYNRIHPLEHRYTIGGTILNTGVDLMGKAINPENNRSTAGKLFSGASKLAGLVPGWGTAASVVLNAVGEGVDSLWGSNINQAAIDSARSSIDSAKSNIGNSLTWDTLADNMEDLNLIDINNIGTQGTFSHKVDNERDKLRRRLEEALAAAEFAKGNISTLENIQMMGTALANGGKIHIKPSKKGTFTAQATKMGMGVQEAARHILANKENYSPAMVKKANFARNASKWHAEGGPIFKTDYDMGLTFVNAGGTHEQNPYGGVFMGMAPDGQPNQVEEGEVIFNDYVYSNRLKVPKAVRNKYKLREKKDLSFADAIEDYIKKNGIEERNNDPIANRGLEAFASELAMEQEMVKAKKEMKNSNKFSLGGGVPGLDKIIAIQRMGTPPQYIYNNSIGGPEFIPNPVLYPNSVVPDNFRLANGGHLFADGDYILYDRNYRDFKNLYNPDSPYMRAINWFDSEEHAAEREALINDIIKGKYGAVPASRAEDIKTNWRSLAQDSKKGPVHNALIAWANQTHADAEANRALGALPEISDSNILNNGVVSTRALNKFRKLDNTSATWNYAADKGGLSYNKESKLPGSTIEERMEKAKQGTPAEDGYDPAYWWRMAGLGANAAGLMYNIFDPYHPQVVNEARYTTMNPKYLGDYMQYNPYDINYATSQQDANNAATRNALMQSTAPIRNASLLANDFNNNATRGATRRQALEYNDSLRKAVTDFNRGTNQFNAQMYTNAAARNQAAKQAYFQDKLRQAQFNSQLDFQHKMQRDQAIGQGLTSIADYLNDMAKQRDSLKMIQAEIDSGARDANAPMRDLLAYFMTGETPKKACGGKLKTKTPKKR